MILYFHKLLDLSEIKCYDTIKIFFDKRGTLWNISTLVPCVYDSFIEEYKAILTPERKEKLRRLLTIRLGRHPRYNLKHKRLSMIEKQIQKRAQMLLEKNTPYRINSYMAFCVIIIVVKD